jgi:hypothetical protein
MSYRPIKALALVAPDHDPAGYAIVKIAIPASAVALSLMLTVQQGLSAIMVALWAVVAAFVGAAFIEPAITWLSEL